MKKNIKKGLLIGVSCLAVLGVAGGVSALIKATNIGSDGTSNKGNQNIPETPKKDIKVNTFVSYNGDNGEYSAFNNYDVSTNKFDVDSLDKSVNSKSDFFSNHDFKLSTKSSVKDDSYNLYYYCDNANLKNYIVSDFSDKLCIEKLDKELVSSFTRGSGVLYGDYYYSFGGCIKPSVGVEHPDDTIFKLNLKTFESSIIGHMPYGSAFSHSAVVGSDYYLFGAYRWDMEKKTSCTDDKIFHFDLKSEKFNEIDFKGTEKINFDIESGFQFQIDDKVYIYSNNNTKPLITCGYVFDLNDFSVSSKVNSSTFNVRSCNCLLNDGLFYCLGGFANGLDTRSVCVNPDNFLLSPFSTNTNMNITDSNTLRINDNIYFIGGKDRTPGTAVSDNYNVYYTNIKNVVSMSSQVVSTKDKMKFGIGIGTGFNYGNSYYMLSGINIYRVNW